MDYAAYLKTPHWQRLATAAKARAGECALCPSTQNLQVHHRTYARLGHEWPNDLIVLCWHCHARFHGTYDDCAERQLTLPWTG